MVHGKSAADIIASTHNTARFFVENRHIAWVLLVATLLWGVYGYRAMPKRKDPFVQVGAAVAVCTWPGAGAERIEQLVTRRIEEKISENAKVERIESIARTHVSITYIRLDERLVDTAKELDDLQLKLATLRDLPEGAGPIQFIKDFTDTTSLMLTVASPRVDDRRLAELARAARRAIEEERARAAPDPAAARLSGVLCLPSAIPAKVVERNLSLLSRNLVERGTVRDVRLLSGPGFVGLDVAAPGGVAEVRRAVEQFVRDDIRASELHPDLWDPAFIGDPDETEARLTAVAGDKFSYRELDDFTDLIRRTLQSLPLVSKVTRSGILNERIFLDYSQERMAGYGLAPASLVDILRARNTSVPGGTIEAPGRNLTIRASGEFASESEIGGVLVAASAGGSPVYLRDAVDITREYESPPRFLNFYTARDAKGRWQRSRAITLGVHMRPGEQIGRFGEAVDAALADLRPRLPGDLILARTSDQPLQVEENIQLFMKSLYEAIALVIVVAFVGFREWRSAALMASSIPLTLAMTFGMMHVAGVDLQQVSIGSLIIALGLLVDDPVVAGDAIKRELGAGHAPVVASWLGPTRLGRAIFFATVTNIVAYLPFLLIQGAVGRFIYSLPVVLTCSLVASRLVSMTFIPLLGYYLLRPGMKPDPPLEERRRKGFPGFYFRVAKRALEHRWAVFAGSLVFLALGVVLGRQLKPQFFPKDLSYLSYVDVWLPDDAPLAETRAAAARAGEVIEEVAASYGAQLGAGREGRGEILKSLTTFVGGGGPRFWFSVAPELPQPNYAQIILQVNDKHDTGHLVADLQRELTAGVPGARIDVRQLETADPTPYPVAVRIAGESVPTLRSAAEQVKAIYRSIPAATGIRTDWGEDGLVVDLRVDPDRANLAGISNLDVAASSVAGMSGRQVGMLREGDRQIPVLARLRMEERSQLGDLGNLYVYSLRNPVSVPLGQIAALDHHLELEKLRRYNQFRTITVACLPVPGALPSEVLSEARPRLAEFARSLPPGYRMEIGGEYEKQRKGFSSMSIAMATSIACIFLALVVQFRHAVKPILVFSAIPYGMVGALAALVLMGAPFGFMAFLGIASLTGVIISHIIVLFDFVEEMHDEGRPFQDALLDSGIVRLRPVAITVGATIFALVPLATHGGPLWEPLCYAQIGGLAVANLITKLLVPALYAIFVLDLKIVKWAAR